MSVRPATLFRAVAVAEAASWAALLVAMFLKHVVGLGEGGVPVVGMVHGILFIVYVVVTLGVFRLFGWGPKMLLLALVAAVPPLATWAFESWALRTGKFDGPESSSSGGVALFASTRA